MNIRASFLPVCCLGLIGFSNTALAEKCRIPPPIAADEYLIESQSGHPCSSDPMSSSGQTKSMGASVSSGWVIKKSYEAPGVEDVSCAYGWGGYNCSVWPRGPELTYGYWSTGGSIYASGSSVWVGCLEPGRSQMLAVDVISPFGLSSSTSISLPCQNQQEY
jgi:hypothetical protein